MRELTEKADCVLPVENQVSHYLFQLQDPMSLLEYCKLLGENFAKMLSRRFTWGNFHDTSQISLIKSYGVYLCVGEIFVKRQYREKRKNYPRAKISTFTVFRKSVYIVSGTYGCSRCHFEAVSCYCWIFKAIHVIGIYKKNLGLPRPLQRRCHILLCTYWSV